MIESVDRSERHYEWLTALVAFLIVGYLAMSRTFAHWGVGPLYVGELSLIAIVFGKPRVFSSTWGKSSLRSGPISSLATAYYIFLTYGIMQSVWGILLGHSARLALQNLVFHVYPAFLFVGLWVGARHTDVLKSWALPFAWILGIYAAVYLAAIKPLGLADADPEIWEDVAWFGQPYGPVVAMLGLLSFCPEARKSVVPFLLNLAAFLALEVRAAWVSFAVALPFWGWLTGNLRRVLIVISLAAVLFAIAFVADLRIPGISTRTSEGATVSVRELTARGLASVSPDLADRISARSSEYAGSVSWRTDWWSALVEKIHQSPVTTLFGLGYGYPIWELHPLDMGDFPLRTPHNGYVYAIAYTGWVGLLLFVIFQLTLGALLWRCYQRTGQAFGISYWLMVLIWVTFDNFLETPFGAIPFYLITGLAASDAIVPESRLTQGDLPGDLTT